MEAWKCWETRITWLTELALIAIGGLFTSLVFLQVVSRYVFGFSVFFIAALSSYLFVWFIFLGAGLAVQRKLHVAFEGLRAQLPPRTAVAVDLVAHGLVFLFLASVMWASWEAVPVALGNSNPALGVSIVWAVLAIPVGCALMIYHQISIFLDRYVFSRRGPPAEADAEIR